MSIPAALSRPTLQREYATYLNINLDDFKTQQEFAQFLTVFTRVSSMRHAFIQLGKGYNAYAQPIRLQRIQSAYYAPHAVHVINRPIRID